MVELRSDGTLHNGTGLSCAQLPSAGALRWVDVVDYNEAMLAIVGERFGFHALALEDCMHAEQRPKVEDYDDTLFVVMQVPDAEGTRWHELYTFVGANSLVTIHVQELPVLEGAFRNANEANAPLKPGAVLAFHRLADRIVDECMALVDRMVDDASSLEITVRKKVVTDSEFERAFALIGRMIHVGSTLQPQQAAMSVLASNTSGWISRDASFHFRDLCDHLTRAVETLDKMRALLENACNVQVSLRSREAVKTLRSLALLNASLLPLLALIAFFLQGIGALPFATTALLWTTLVLVPIAAIPAVLIARARGQAVL